MKDYKGLKFSSSIGVLFELKKLHNCKTLNETYKILENTDLDAIFEVLCISHNKATNKQHTIEEFVNLLEDNKIGFIKVTEIFRDLVEDIMFNGMSEEEISDRKKSALDLK